MEDCESHLKSKSRTKSDYLTFLQQPKSQDEGESASSTNKACSQGADMDCGTRTMCSGGPCPVQNGDPLLCSELRDCQVKTGIRMLPGAQ